MTTGLKVSIERRLSAPPERVFRAFSDPGFLPRWFSPAPEIRMEILEFAFEVGGRYRFAYHLPDGGRPVVCGTYQEIVPFRRIVFSWTWEEPDPHAGIETVVTISIDADRDGTLLRVRHEGFPDEESRVRHNAGWNGALERLASETEETRDAE